MRRSRLVEYDGGPMLSFGVRLTTCALVVGVVVLMVGIGYHLMTIPPPSAEEQRVASRQEQLQVQAQQESLERDRAAAVNDQELDAHWRPWRAAAVNVLEISVTLAPVLGLGIGTVVLLRQGRPPRDPCGGPRRPWMLSTRSWLRSRSWGSRPATATPSPWGTAPPAPRPPGGAA